MQVLKCAHREFCWVLGKYILAASEEAKENKRGLISNGISVAKQGILLSENFEY